jgi:hypothetical protein
MPNGVNLIKDGNGVNTITIRVSPLQAALIEYFRRYPYSRIRELKIHEGVPLEAEVYIEGMGAQIVRFDKLAKDMNLLPKGVGVDHS